MTSIVPPLEHTGVGLPLTVQLSTHWDYGIISGLQTSTSEQLLDEIPRQSTREWAEHISFQTHKRCDAFLVGYQTIGHLGDSIDDTRSLYVWKMGSEAMVLENLVRIWKHQLRRTDATLGFLHLQLGRCLYRSPHLQLLHSVKKWSQCIIACSRELWRFNGIQRTGDFYARNEGSGVK